MIGRNKSKQPLRTSRRLVSPPAKAYLVLGWASLLRFFAIHDGRERRDVHSDGGRNGSRRFLP